MTTLELHQPEQGCDAAMPFDALLNALPHPVLLLGPANRIIHVTSAAETFFQASAPLLCRQTLDDIVGFGSPLLALVEQVRASNATVNEYGVDLGSPRTLSSELVDIHVDALARCARNLRAGLSRGPNQSIRGEHFADS